ncbi:zinc-dependent metalloprotease [Microbacterium esteraromaticum]|uniref:Zinc-dependent metalloprotease n=1 Tax=Microbacterium esteraromaticum TaxID=57043 RepID=A0A7D8AKD8_9MICO|nr:zinc-dependent metalloprotease [Microbacterium esteraromaticum]QMU97706.1 zinc-dependent metalloprotease [Microbacterium esteraromaticum]
MTDDDRDPSDFEEMLRRMMSGGQVDPEALRDALSGMGGMPIDPAQMSGFMSQLQGMFGGDPWQSARQQALHIANRDGLGIADGSRASLADAFGLADLWLGEATTISELAGAPQAMTRGEWVEKTLPVWKEIADPVSTSIADALTDALETQVPPEMQSMVQGAGQLMRGLGGSLFAAQFGQVLGRLSLEVVSGGDVGIPVLPAGTAAVIPQNIADFGEGLEIPEDQITLYLAVRELAYARLYRHAKWLHLHVLSQITDFARGVTVDIEALEGLASRLDPTDPEELRAAIEGGALLPAQTETQREALARLENLIATIDGWVDVVTEEATSRLPDGGRLAEAARRRRAVGGPAEDALGALVGLKLRPRRLREASAMWRAVTDAVGIAARDALWDYPDLMPLASDIDDPSALIARLEALQRGEAPEADEFDEALARLLDGEVFGQGDAPAHGDRDDTAPDEGDRPEGDRPEGDRPEGDRPV